MTARPVTGETPGEGSRTEGPPHLDGTLGGYFLEHNRPPGFEGSDGEPYTVSLEVERTPNLSAPYEGYVVFLRWASTGLGVVGHLETPTLRSGGSREAVIAALGEIPLAEAKALLDEAIARSGPEARIVGRST